MTLYPKLQGKKHFPPLKFEENNIPILFILTMEYSKFV